MNGWKVLRKLQTLPDEKKQVVAFLGAASITSVIFAVWLVATFAAIDRDAQTASAGLSEQAASVIGPWEAMTEQFGGIIETAQQSLASIRNKEAGQ